MAGASDRGTHDVAFGGAKYIHSQCPFLIPQICAQGEGKGRFSLFRTSQV